MSHTTTETTISTTAEQGSASGSGDDEDEVLEKYKSIVINQVIYLSIVGVVGTIANLTVIYRAIRYKNGLTRSCGGSYRSATIDTTNMLVISLAVSNLGTATFSVGIFIFPMYFPEYAPINEFTCRFIWPARELFTAVSILSFTCIAVGRYLILFRSFRNIRLFSYPIANNVAVWIFSYLLFALPYTAAYKPINLNGSWVCDTNWETPEAQSTYVVFIVLFAIFTPTIFVAISYIGIIRRLKRARNVVTPVNGANIPETQEALSIAVHSLRAVRISMLLLLSFIITFLPFGVLALSIEYNDLNGDDFPQLEMWYAVAFCLLHSGAIMDPFILMLSSSAYRPDCALIKRIFSR